MPTVTVNAEALREVLQALVGPSHLIGELRVLRDIPKLPGMRENPINILLREYNAAAEAAKE